MTDLVVIFGPPASGKAAVGTALAALASFRLFHNHMTAEPVAALFGWQTPQYAEATAQIRLALLERALTSQQDGASQSNIVFTFVWAFDLDEDNRFMASLVSLFERHGRRVFFVELQASLAARIEREGTPLRLSLKPAKHNVERARAMHLQIEGLHRMNSSSSSAGVSDFPYLQRYLQIDTEASSPEQAAESIVEHFGFTRLAG